MSTATKPAPTAPQLAHALLDLPGALPRPGRKINASTLDVLGGKTAPPELAEAAERLAKVESAHRELARKYRRLTGQLDDARSDDDDAIARAVVAGDEPPKRSAEPAVQAERAEVADLAQGVARAYRIAYRDLQAALLNVGPSWRAALAEADQQHQADLGAAITTIREASRSMIAAQRVGKLLDRVEPLDSAHRLGDMCNASLSVDELRALGLDERGRPFNQTQTGDGPARSRCSNPRPCEVHGTRRLPSRARPIPSSLPGSAASLLLESGELLELEPTLQALEHFRAVSASELMQENFLPSGYEQHQATLST